MSKSNGDGGREGERDGQTWKGTGEGGRMEQPSDVAMLNFIRGKEAIAGN